jgi:hypothetical protein
LSRLIVFCLLALALSSCAPKYQAVIEFRDGSTHRYSLVSIRDTSVVVLEPYERTDEYLSFSHCQVFRDSLIRRIKFEPRGGFLRWLPLMLFGAGTGSTFAEAGSDDFFYYTVIGLAAGYYLATMHYLLESNIKDWLYLWVPDDRRQLMEGAIFEQEPPIMNYVK